ncbi:UNVERIFIED_CONTAM: DNA-directed DNA polymerase gamma mip1 [Siphonaria sp. JEL0065]|nr:DNA-directed DNA polymerase gamma mip1 [Siphonaria sp. JEL0065]
MLLSEFNLLGKQEPALRNVDLKLPKLATTSNSLGDHFRILGSEQSEPFRGLALKLAQETAPPMPEKWCFDSGWTKYNKDGTTQKVDAPDGNALVFDIENMWKKSPYSVLAVALSENGWFGWVSPELTFVMEGEQEETRIERADQVYFKTLIPLGLSKENPKIVVGHNVSYDRARVLEEYNLNANSVGWIDTLSLHCAVNGLSSQQRSTWMKYKKAKKEVDDIKMAPETVISAQDKSELLGEVLYNVMDVKKDWMDVGAMNSLKHVAKLYLGVELDKDPRAVFENGSVMDVVDCFQDSMVRRECGA